ncbi:helix-turn-helix domain-containing protein [Bilifractor sp. LCP21S3_A7]|uniref:helix-turn-helix domain-containing protein n=1 Tax=Bilifractor sp. LCP21S3_A7 TaxID=3438738 RepID=UPI003F914C7F
MEATTHCVTCPEHGVVTAAVPWAYSQSSFTKDFDLTVAWLATYLTRSAVSNYMRIDWQTVGSCMSRALRDLEPERTRRLNGLVNIGIDETSYLKGHKYITVVVNRDTNTVVWVANGPRSPLDH